MTQESLRRFWKKTKNKSGAIMAGIAIGCAVLCTPSASVNAGASGIDPLPPFTQAESGYIKNGCFNGTFFVSQERVSNNGDYDMQFFSLGTQDNYTKEIGANNVYYVPNQGAYDKSNGQWLTEIFGESVDRPESHVLQGQIQVDVDKSVIYFGMELQETWVEINTFKKMWENCQITITQDISGENRETAICEYIGFRVEYIGQAGEILHWDFNAEKRSTSNTYDLRKTRDITPTYSFTDTSFPFETRGYIYVKDLQFLGKANIDRPGLVRVRISKTDSIPTIPLSVAEYTQDVNKLHMNFYEENKNIGNAIFSPVVAFINTEIFPGFTFGTMLLMGLGVIVLGLYLKFALGG